MKQNFDDPDTSAIALLFSVTGSLERAISFDETHILGPLDPERVVLLHAPYSNLNTLQPEVAENLSRTYQQVVNKYMNSSNHSTFDIWFSLYPQYEVLSSYFHEFRNLQKRSINLKTRKNQGVHILSGYPCIKDIYKTFLQVSSLRYSGLALSEVSPSPLSHDTVSRWLKSRCFRPKDLWRLVEPSIDKKSPCVLIADDTLIAKTRTRVSHKTNLGTLIKHGFAQ